jgi:peptide-methionine (S)-S-oxide reductase
MIKKAVVAGGCFWGLEDLIREVKGVVNTEAGYTGGENENPTYENHPGHAETLEIEYEDEQLDYQHLLDFFFQIHNPTTLNQQGNDKGTAYRSAIFYANDEEKQIAQEMIETVDESDRWDNPVVTTLEPLNRFWPAEAYHQDYLVKNPGGYTCHAIYFDSYLI